MRLVQPMLAALFASGVVLCAACGGGGGSSATPGGGGAPTTPTPTLPPTPTPVPSSTVEPVVPGSANVFPTVEGAGGKITFPAGSTSPAGNTVELSTSANSAPSNGYPSILPSGVLGAGSVAISPWLTFRLKNALTTDGPIAVTVESNSCSPGGVFYLAIFDLAAPSVPVAVTSSSCSNGIGSGTLGRSRQALRAGNSYYLGFFYLSSGPPPTNPPCATPPPVSRTVAVALATPIPFPTQCDYGGMIYLPAGSTPVNGNKLTLTTGVHLPSGYPPAIPPGPGNYGVGATAVAPWLTYSVSETLNTNGNNPSLQYIFPAPPPSAFYYVGVYDLTANPNEPFLTFAYDIAPQVRARGGRVNIPLQKHLGGVSPNSLTGGDKYYFGLFAQPDGNNILPGQSTVSPSGGTFTFPSVDGFSGSATYGASDASSGSVMQLTSSNVDFTGGEIPPLNSNGTPVFYEGFLLTTGAEALQFGSATTGKLSSSTFTSGTAYNVCGWDVTNWTPSSPAVLVYSALGLIAQKGSLGFPTPFNNFSFGNNHTIIYEFVQDTTAECP